MNGAPIGVNASVHTTYQDLPMTYQRHLPGRAKAARTLLRIEARPFRLILQLQKNTARSVLLKDCRRQIKKSKSFAITGMHCREQGAGNRTGMQHSVTGYVKQPNTVATATVQSERYGGT